ncbi:hypothetical protein HCN44_007039 [Aphidius gifuensis]|uniref:39S ribosomal protein L12, mitochondrial n=1 Tax=Aphidius gifuensis TaxID=684658 RepID=A0A834Y392_APHGI|nr:39S ribosomal protein L12, mitochondrial [Aphidius gifuensis]KAF7995932.1 hypothetical protein HCN44_007039 [Aphidius gifuensis]
MMNTLRMVSQRRMHQLRQFHNCMTYCEAAVAPAAVEKLSIPLPESVDKPISPKIEKLAQEITTLNLIEVSELSDLLKKRLNLPDAPVMPMGGMVMAKTDEEAVPERVKTSFTVKLTKFDDKQKVALIKEIKTLIPGMNLVQAKKFVESAPTDVKSDVSKEEAEQLKAAIVKVGGEVEIV